MQSNDDCSFWIAGGKISQTAYLPWRTAGGRAASAHLRLGEVQGKEALKLICMHQHAQYSDTLPC